MSAERATLTFVKEPRGPLYQALLDHALGISTSGLLVVRDDLGLEPSAERCLAALGPFIVATEARSSWPGTILQGHTAKVISFRFDAGSAQVLKTFSTALYDWVQPALPEDLCLLRSNGEPWLTTIAHEKDAFLALSGAERSALLTAVADLELGTPALPTDS